MVVTSLIVVKKPSKIPEPFEITNEVSSSAPSLHTLTTIEFPEIQPLICVPPKAQLSTDPIATAFICVPDQTPAPTRISPTGLSQPPDCVNPAASKTPTSSPTSRPVIPS